jgi:hypothetical protein
MCPFSCPRQFINFTGLSPFFEGLLPQLDQFGGQHLFYPGFFPCLPSYGSNTGVGDGGAFEKRQPNICTNA